MATNRRFNVQDVAYGAVGDALKVVDAQINGGIPNIVNSASAAWAPDPAEVGKLIWVNDPAGVNTLAPCNIVTRVSATQVQVSGAAVGNVTGGTCVWGTDDTTAIQNARAASAAAYKGTAAGVVELPANGYIIGARLYNNVGAADAAEGASFVGDGRSNTKLFVRPDLTIPGDGTAAIFQNTGYGGVMRGIGVDCCGALFALAVDQDMIRFTQTTNAKCVDVDLRNFGNSGADGAKGISFRGSSDFAGQDIFCVASGIGSATLFGIWFDDVGGVARKVFSSNWPFNILVSNHNGRDPVSTPLSFFGGGTDEAGGVPLVLQNAVLNAYGIIVFGGGDANGVAISLDATSRLYISDSNVGRFQGYTGANVPLENAGVVVSRGTTWRGNAAGNGPARFMVNSGIYIDGGGNDYRRYSNDTDFTPATPADCFNGHQPVVLGSWYPYAAVPR